MADAVVLFAATSHAMRAERLLKEAGIRGRLIPVPRHLSSDCGLALSVPASVLSAAVELLGSRRVQVEGIHQPDS